MDPSIVVLQWTNAAAFSAVGLVAIRAWWRRRDAQHAALALAVGGLGIVSALGRAAPALGYPRWLSDVSMIAFLASGWGLLQFRHSVMPLSVRARRVALTAILASGVAVMAARLPTEPHSELSALQMALVVTVVVVWCVCVGEPALRFYRAARGRALVVRRRLRALSVGYVGIVLILVIAVATQPDAEATAAQFAFGLAALMLAPLMYVSLAPPSWLRKRWRGREEGALRAAVQQIVRSPDAQSAAEEGLAWSLRILGAEAGILTGSNGCVLASIGFDPIEAAAIATKVQHHGIVPFGDDRRRHLAVCTLDEHGASGVLAVASGPFSPVFGRDEVETLRDLATTIAGALERHALTQALRAESIRYSSLLNAISDLGVAVTMSRDGRIVSTNEALCEISGHSRMELLAMSSLFEVIPEDWRAQLAERYTRFLDGEGDDSWEAPIRHKNGELRDLEGASKLLEIDGTMHVLTIARDVTERKAASERDRRRAQQLDALARSTRALASMRSLDELYPAIAAAASSVSNRAEAFIGVPGISGEMLWYDAAGAAEASTELLALTELTVHEHRPHKIAYSGGSSRDDGRTRYAMTAPILRRGQLLGIIALRADTAFDDIDESVAASLAAHAAEVITGARALERERAMTRRLRELDDIKNSFLAAVSHELRTPLTSVLGFAHTLQRLGARIPADERALLIDRLTANAEKLGSLLTDLLDLDRLNRGIIEPSLRPTDLCSLILRAVESFDFPDPRAVHVDVTPITAAVDGPKIERVVENLLANAIRHTRAETPIWVRARRDDDGVTISVEDAGPGVPREMRQRIFEPFQQGATSEHAPGVGIGLSLVARFAELHGGRAWVTDRPGGGASFRVWLPDARLDGRPSPARSVELASME